MKILFLHGWQLVDEMNRLFAAGGVTGYVFPVHLVTADNIAADGGDRLPRPAHGERLAIAFSPSLGRGDGALAREKLSRG